MSFHYDRMVIGYHGCRLAVAEGLLAGKPFSPSKNAWDWLGEGAYFWEFGYQRAADWASDRYGDDGAVVGAVIQLGNCLDLLDTRSTRALAGIYPVFASDVVERQGLELPRNRGKDADKKLRDLDCAVINFLAELAAEESQPFDTVRGVFQEGEPAYPGAFIRAESHIQVAVRNLDCIIGVFRPRESSTPVNP